MRYPDKSEELYDMRIDPGQFTNLAKDPGQDPIRKQLAAQLDARLTKAKPNHN